MDQRIYITHLTSEASASELKTWLEKRLNVQCSAFIKKGKIPGTQIAFVSIGTFNAEKAISMLNNADFMGNRIKVHRYIQTERNRKFQCDFAVTPKDQEKSPPRVSESAASCRQSLSTITVSGAVVHIVSASEFYVQEVRDMETMKIINAYLDLLDRGGVKNEPVEPVAGKICAARYSVDNTFYRALITTKEVKENVAVTFVDFGNIETVPCTSLVTIPEDISKLDFVAKRCRFHDLKILDEDNVLKVLRDCGEKFNIVIHVEDDSDSGFKMWEVDLVEEATGQSVRQKLIDSGYGHAEIVESSISGEENPPHARGLVEILSSATCIVSHVESAERFYLQGAFGQEKLAQIYECLLTASTLPQVEVAEASQSNIYAAVFSKDRTWYRCQLREDSAGNSSSPTVCFIDFGNSETLSSELRVLPERISAIRAQALACQLTDLRITSPSKVKTELEGLGSQELPLKCQLQETPGTEVASVDFSVEGKFPSFCSWLIENRLAERVYKHTSKASTNNATPTRPNPPQVAKRKLEAVSGTSGRKYNGFRSKNEPVRNNNWSPRSAGAESTPSEGNERPPPETLSTELAEALILREALVKWRGALIHDGKPLVAQLTKLMRIRDGEVGTNGDASSILCHLVSLRDSVVNIRSELCKSMTNVKDTLNAANFDETVLLSMTEVRDDAAKRLVKSVSEFENEIGANDAIIKEQISDVEAIISKMDFLLKQRFFKMADEMNGSSDSEATCERIWDQYFSSSTFSKVIAETESRCKEFEETREALALITGDPCGKGVQKAMDCVTSFFPKVKALNAAMGSEVEAYALHFLGGKNGQQVTAMLEQHVTLARDMLQELQKLEDDRKKMKNWREEAARVLDGLAILSNGTVENVEDLAAKRKKARSKLRHLLADLEDEEESVNGGSEKLHLLRESLVEVRCGLHTILEQENDVKNIVTDALELRPELLMQLKKRLKGDSSLIDNTDIVSSWEVSYFDLQPLESEDNCFFSSKFKGDEVFIQKVLLPPENRSNLLGRLRRYKAIASSATALAPLLAAFVPPRDNHVLYLVSPMVDLFPANASADDVLHACQAILTALQELRNDGLSCSTTQPLQFLGRLRNHPEKRLVLLPVLQAQEGSADEDLTNVIDILTKEASTNDRALPALNNILTSITSLEHIPAALNRINALLSMLTSPIQVDDKIDAIESTSKSESSIEVDDDMNMNGDKDVEVVIAENGKEADNFRNGTIIVKS